jgi:GNAT superfamily N-acetyltransferase
MQFIRLFEEETEDTYLAKHKTGSISSSAYARSEQPGGLGGIHTIDECPKVISTMIIKPVDGLTGIHSSGKTYRELVDLIGKVRREVSSLRDPDDFHIISGYPAWFKTVCFVYNGEWQYIKQKNEAEIGDKNNLINMMVRHVLYYVYNLEGIEDGVVNYREGSGTTQISFRQTGKKSRYVRTDTNGDVVRINGEAGYFTDEEVLEKGYPLYDDTVYAFDGPNCVGYASNEFGAVGIFVERNYQRQGIGKELLRLYQSQFKKEKKLGQMTPAGENLTRSYFRKYVAKG